jgi:hypothetical protein
VTINDWSHPYSREQAAYPLPWVRAAKFWPSVGGSTTLRRSQSDLHLPADGGICMRILNAEQMREADRRTIQDIGIASLVLMENAGRQVVAGDRITLFRSRRTPHRDRLRQRVTMAATASSLRGRCSSAASRCRCS